MTSCVSPGPVSPGPAFNEAPARHTAMTSGLAVRLWRPSNTAVVVHVAGELDTSNTPRLYELLAPRLNSMVRVLVLDLSELGFLGVAGLQLLADARQRAGTRDMTVCLVDGPVCVDRALRAAGWTETVPTYSTVAAAVADLPEQVRKDTSRVGG